MSAPVRRFGTFELDEIERRLLRDGKVVSVPPKAFDVLTLLVRSSGRLVRRQELFHEVWPGVDVEDANLTNNITALRRVLGPNSIASVPKHGYRFCLPVSTSPELMQEASRLLSDAQNLLSKRTADDVLRSRDLLWLVTAHEPQCATAWAWLGRAARFLDKNGVDRLYHRSLTDVAFQRAFTIDPDLGCAHQFLTNVQVDRGHAFDALTRLLRLVKEGRADAYSFASLVQVCRFCGLQEASVAAHARATQLSPRIDTSVTMTHFARCEYDAVIESYNAASKGAGIYLDLCAWACLGFTKKAEKQALHRLNSYQLAPMFKALLEGLVNALRGDAAEVRRICLSQEIYEDPESLLHLGRHLAFSRCDEDALKFLKSVVSGGLAIPEMLEGDPWLAGLKDHPEFRELIEQARGMQRRAQSVLTVSRVSGLSPTSQRLAARR